MTRKEKLDAIVRKFPHLVEMGPSSASVARLDLEYGTDVDGNATGRAIGHMQRCDVCQEIRRMIALELAGEKARPKAVPIAKRASPAEIAAARAKAGLA